jgi:hypothetical protein
MTTLDNLTNASGRRRRKQAPSGDIPLPDGDVFITRKKFAEKIGVSERSIARMGLVATTFGNVAYIKERASLQIMADRVERRNQPQKRRRA